MKDNSFDVIIVGAGIMGTFHAYHCLKRGLRVALIEKNTQPQGATVRNFGQIVPSGMDIKWQRLGRRSTEIYKDIQSQVDIGARQYGSIYIASNPDEQKLIEELAIINENEGYDSILLSAEKCLEKWPGLKETYCHGGLYFPDEIVVNPRTLIHNLIRYLQDKFNLNYISKTSIISVEYKASHCICLDNYNNTYYAENAFICSGSEANLLFPKLFEAHKIEAVKLQMLRTVPQPKQRIKGSILTGRTIKRYEAFQACPSYKGIKKKEDKNSFANRYGVHILFKQSEDNRVIIGDSHEYSPMHRQDTLGFDLQEEINHFMIEEAKKIFDLEDWTIDLSWSGIYAQMTEKDIFQHTFDNSIHVVTGIGGKGMTAAAGFAEQHISEIFD